MTNRIVRAMLLLVLLWAGAAFAAGESATRFLFVGNSLSYVGNLPAVFDALCRANGHAVHSEMLVEGGATLADRVQDASGAAHLVADHYDYLVLQERGGDLIGGFGEGGQAGQPCRDGRSGRAPRADTGTQPLYLGDLSASGALFGAAARRRA